MSQFLPTGKLPADFLASLLKRAPRLDSRVIIGLGIGQDTAVIDAPDHYLVAKTDPIIFATDAIGWYAVNVNANDIACMGARIHTRNETHVQLCQSTSRKGAYVARSVRVCYAFVSFTSMFG
jgi:selenophosphate synthetase-related protein